MRRYSLFQRGSIWYAQLKNPQTNSYLSARSTGQTEKDEAYAVVVSWLREGMDGKKPDDLFGLDAILSTIRTARLTKDDAGKIVEEMKKRGLVVSAIIADTRGAESFVDFLKTYWTYADSPMVAEKKDFGQSITKTHCAINLSRVGIYYRPFFGSKPIADITMADLKAFAKHLEAIRPALAPVTKNHIFTAGRTALAWAKANQIIMEDPSEGIPNFAGGSQARGVLTPDEAQALFALPWRNELAKLANLTQACTGLRIMEVLSLRADDISETAIAVRRSYSRLDGFKLPKTNKPRTIPIRGELKNLTAALLENYKLNPHQNGMLFWSGNVDTPMQNQAALDALKEALVLLKVGNEATEEEKEKAGTYWRGRAIGTHSWRHFWSARIADRVEKRQAMLVVGHATESVFDNYADHAQESDLNDVGAAMSEAFGRIIPFKPKVEGGAAVPEKAVIAH